MTHSFLDTQLDLIEQQFNEMGAVWGDANPHQAQLSIDALQKLTVDLMQMVDEEGRSSLLSNSRMQRIQALAKTLQPLREGLLRRSAYVERALEIVMPASQKATYAGGAKYGGAIRQSGEFKVLSA